MNRRLFVNAILLVFLISGFACSAEQGCFTIVVGKAVAADGWVLMAHNEDDSPPQVVHHRKVPWTQHSAGTEIEILPGHLEAQKPVTWAYLWSEMPGMNYSDSFLNQWGVCVTSNNCPSREDRPELVDGGIKKMLRQLIAQRARSAREGVQIAAEYIERYGYGASGRTYTISDPNESWLLAVVKGKHWVAARVPEDRVAMVANTYTIHQIDLADTANYRGADDLIDYAAARGWYDPERDGEFDFAAAYTNPNSASNANNYMRRWAGLTHISAVTLEPGPGLPFAIKPKQTLGLRDLMAILRDHYEETDVEKEAYQTGNPHDGPVSSICGRATQTSFVAQLRGNFAPEIGLVYWAALAPPCGSVYLPFYFGMDDFPEGYASDLRQPTEQQFLAQVNRAFEPREKEAFWTFSNLFVQSDMVYTERMPQVQQAFRALEEAALEEQATIDEEARSWRKKDADSAAEYLTDYTIQKYAEAIKVMAKFKYTN